MFDIATLFSDPSMAEARQRLAEGWKSAGLHDGTTLGDAIVSAGRHDPDNTLIFHSAEHSARLRLDDLERESASLARALLARGFESGDVVAVQMPNRVETLLLYAALARIGCIFVPIVHIYGPSETNWILDASGARAFFCPDRWQKIDFLSRLDEMPASRDLEVFIVGDHVPENATAWSELVAQDPGEGQALPAISADAPLLIVYTSGTTADPKGVLHTHHSMMAELRDMPHLPMGRSDIVSLQPWPAGHIGGLCALLGPIVTGGHCILMDRWDPEAAPELVAEHSVTTLCGTPFHITAMLDLKEKGDPRLETITDVMSGGAGVPPELVERCDAAGWVAVRAYGSTEHPTASAGNVAMDLPSRANTDGAICAHSEIRLVDDSGTDVGPGEPGEIWLRGPEQFVGYTDPSFNEQSFAEGGWFRTGDVGVIDESGALTITDRVKDIIIRGGENLSSLEIEDLVLRHESVAEAAAVGLPDDRYGERVCVFVVPASGATAPTVKDFQRHFEKLRVAKQKTPEHVVPLDEMPRTPAGKIKKEVLRRTLSATPHEGMKDG